MHRLSFTTLAFFLTLSSLSLSTRSANALTSMSAEATQAAAQADMLQTLNDYRYAVGAPTIGADARVNTAAQNHANYSSANGYMGHFESSGLPYFTGYSARDRLIAAGSVRSN